jgi:hypothetical protein
MGDHTPTGSKNFWTGGLSGIKDPKRNFRFRVSFVGTDSNPLMDGGIWFAKSCTQPSLTFTESSVDFMMHKFYWPAKATWNTIDMVLIDPVEPHATGKLLQMIENTGFKIPTNSNGDNTFKSVSKAGASTTMGNIFIEQLDAEGNPNHSWTLIHAWAQEISFSNLDYASEDLMEITFKIRYDWAQFDSNVTGDGVNTGGLFKP